MKIKAISIWQPWASLIAVGAKKYETRSWETKYRGPILICSSKKILPVREILGLYPELDLFNHLGPKYYRIGRGPLTMFYNLPFGEAVAIADLTKIIPNKNCFPAQMDGAMPFGDFSPGRFAWKLENIRAIDPFPVRGKQGLFDVEVPDSLFK
jgi:hypothetical protein